MQPWRLIVVTRCAYTCFFFNVVNICVLHWLLNVVTIGVQSWLLNVVNISVNIFLLNFYFIIVSNKLNAACVCNVTLVLKYK